MDVPLFPAPPGHPVRCIKEIYMLLTHFYLPPLSFNFQPQVRGAAYLLCRDRGNGINKSTRHHILHPRRDDDVDNENVTSDQGVGGGRFVSRLARRI
jgi:hypothetical protein